MIIPTKHTNFSQSLIGFGSYILSKLEKNKSVDELWNEYLDDYENKRYPAKHNFDNLILTLLFLYTLGILEERDGSVIKCD
ncbi:MAG: hypothetical protein GX383_01525 [Clostridium sp.]|nr:hypothetical protein [Clostridium sp.]